MTIIANEIASQRSFAASDLLSRRKRIRMTLIVAAYALVAAAATAAAGFAAGTTIGAYLMIGAGLVGGVLVYIFERCRSELRTTHLRLDEALDAMAAARALAAENRASGDTSRELDRAFHELNARRTMDIFGRQHSILYSDTKTNRRRKVS